MFPMFVLQCDMHLNMNTLSMPKNSNSDQELYERHLQNQLILTSSVSNGLRPNQACKMAGFETKPGSGQTV